MAYEVLQPAAAVLRTFEGERASDGNPRFREMQSLLRIRTAKQTWIPSRTGNPGVLWNPEGDIYRNKARLFSSMFILEPKDEDDPRIRMLPFGAALGSGRFSRQDYYEFIIGRFRYPHPAFPDNWAAWTSANRLLFPFSFILQVLVSIARVDASSATLSSTEIGRHLYPISDHSSTKSIAQKILDERRTHGKGESTRLILARDTPTIVTTDVRRKFEEMLDFLCMSGFTYYLPTEQCTVGLNLRATHTTKFAVFEHKYGGEDRLKFIESTVSRVDGNDYSN
jgi:hypothetical protein